MKKASAAIIGIVSFIMFSCNEKNDKKPETKKSGKEAMLFSKGDKVPNNKFVGNVYQAILSDEGTRVSNVTFEAKGRTNWHNHPGGQTLLVTDGVGYHQEEGKPVQKIKKGDVIKVGKNIKHWHGGSENQSMTHIAVSIDHEKNPSQWFEPVTDEQFTKEISKK
ncbi:cupin domain-containing protein [Chryseobacterium sp. JAH]|uniref:cupin domain-containing protein n=1 Tax=Chryseobacterium sp. JAH TaxID=1742858 RepID=UPI0007411E85|nr:cupin domain-containing protein [Chryseobacterium sp. JAH]KUJ50928.1 hypothetical protein AR685_11880 [Chryseobacterium sp. JAH]